PRRRGRATSDERCESLKINMFRMPCGLVAAWAAQHERFEGGHTAVWTRYVVVGDLDRGEVAALRPGIDGECGEAVGVGRVSHRRPGRVLLHVDRRTLACFGSGSPTAVITRHCGGLKNNWFDGKDVPPPPITMCTVPLVVSITSVAVAARIGVRVRFYCWPRIGCDRS